MSSSSTRCFSGATCAREITAVHRQTERSVTLTLRPNENWRGIRAGQFVTVSVQVDGVLLARPYSPAGPERPRTARLS